MYIPEPLIRNFLYIRTKQDSFARVREHISTLFLGSSHVAHAFLPQFFPDYAFNFGTTSQDLYTSYALYKKATIECPSLCNIVLGVSVFTPGYCLYKTTQSYLCDFLSMLSDIKYPVPPQIPVEVMEIVQQQQSCLIDERGFCNFSFTDMQEVLRRVRMHLRENKRKPNQLEYLHAMIGTAREHGHNLYVVSMPARSDYRNRLDSGNVLFSAIEALCNQHGICYIDLYTPPPHTIDLCYEIVDTDFYDSDHLNQEGAKKCTEYLYTILSQRGAGI